eukprot:comp21538_c0_seq1/m.47111 comp21538_c0_seq1/g.47111  ORF comp21538_c0_seq1/g.47111 comp21538_c0_seq1/m.47111 type:complete len:378 (-) comp21538_c0_seq1:1123-2256(-)
MPDGGREAIRAAKASSRQIMSRSLPRPLPQHARLLRRAQPLRPRALLLPLPVVVAVDIARRSPLQATTLRRRRPPLEEVVVVARRRQQVAVDSSCLLRAAADLHFRRRAEEVVRRRRCPARRSRANIERAIPSRDRNKTLRKIKKEKKEKKSTNHRLLSSITLAFILSSRCSPQALSFFLTANSRSARFSETSPARFSQRAGRFAVLRNAVTSRLSCAIRFRVCCMFLPRTFSSAFTPSRFSICENSCTSAKNLPSSADASASRSSCRPLFFRISANLARFSSIYARIRWNRCAIPWNPAPTHISTCRCTSARTASISAAPGSCSALPTIRSTSSSATCSSRSTITRISASAGPLICCCSRRCTYTSSSLGCCCCCC